jgi:hypothetical protein
MSNLDTLTFAELNELKANIEQRMASLREQGVPQLLEEFTRKAAEFGLELDEVCGSGARKPRPRGNKHVRTQD